MFTVVILRKGLKSVAQPFEHIERAMQEAQSTSRYLTDQAMIYERGNQAPRCIYQHGELISCRCPNAETSRDAAN